MSRSEQPGSAWRPITWQLRPLLLLLPLLLMPLLLLPPMPADAAGCDGGPGVYLYGGTGFPGGDCQKFTQDVNYLGDVPGNLNDRVWSIRVVGPYRATVYRDPGYSGVKETFTWEDSDLGNNDIFNTTSSLRVAYSPCDPGAAGVVLFAQPNYAGVCTNLTADASDLANSSVGNDNTWSIKTNGGYTAVLYRDPGYSGLPETFTASDANLSDNSISNTASSLRVVPPRSPTPTLTQLPSPTPAPMATPVRPTNTPVPIATVTNTPVSVASGQDAISNFRITGVTDTEIQVTVDYAYNSDHGSNVYLAAYALQGGNQLPWFGFSPVQASRGNNTATVPLIYGFNNAPPTATADQVRVDLYVGGGSTFYSRMFNYTKQWGPYSSATSTPTAIVAPTNTPGPMPPSGNLVHCGPNAGYTISSCFANGEYGDGGDDAAWRAADRDLNTQWSSRESLNSWWQVSFAAPVTVAQVAIWGRGNGDTISGRLEFSDGSVVDFGTLNGDGHRRAESFPPRITTFIRFHVTGMGNRSTTGFKELEAYSYQQYPDGDDAGGSPPPPTPQKGQVFGLSKGTQIHTGPGLSFPSTIPQVPWGSVVPEDNWQVLIQDDPSSPQCVDGWRWWNIDRGAVDHVGGTGWAAIDQCTTAPQPTHTPQPREYILGAGILAKYQSMGGPSGPLGAARSDEFDAAPSPNGTTGRVVRFTRGSIYWSAEYGAHAIYDEWGSLYEGLEGTGGWLGFPTGDLEVRGGRIAIQFENGYIAFDSVGYRAYRPVDIPPSDLSSPPEAANSEQLADSRGTGLLVVGWDDLARAYPDLHQRYDELKPWIQGAYIAARGGQCVAPMVPLVAVAAAPGGGGLAVYGLVTNLSYNKGCQFLYREAEKQLLGVNTSFLPGW